MILPSRLLLPVLSLLIAITPLFAEPIDHDTALRRYFEAKTSQVESETAERLHDLDEFQTRQSEYRQQLAEMLGLHPQPEKTPLKPTVTGEIKTDSFTVKNLHYQALPGLYVTANLYLPNEVTEPLPAILYVCGHSRNVKDGVSYGNKVGYHHHGVWFASNGYVCLTIDTIQLGEFQGVHHGTYRGDMWWWNSRGYTPAGVEAWTGIRGIDYLQSLEQVDPERIGVTGRSGGGAYSWWVAALDERVKAAVPVAGITSMRNHVVDDCIEGHCDCMFQINNQQWDFSMIPALVAPRALLITNTDKDSIFPLDGVMDVYWDVRRVYDHYDAGDKLGVAIAEGPHKDTQRLQVNAFEWFDRFLKKTDRVSMPAQKLFEPEELRVFRDLPEDERTSNIHDTFVPTSSPEVPETASAWKQQTEQLKNQLREKCFPDWPADSNTPELTSVGESTTEDIVTETLRFESEASVPLTLTLKKSRSFDKNKPASLKFHVNTGDTSASPQSPQEIVAIFAPRGVGPHAWSGDDREQIHIRRRFALLGQTADASRVWDIIAAVNAVRGRPECKEAPCELIATGSPAVNALYAALFASTPVDQLTLSELPASHQDGPDYLGVLKILDIPYTLAMVANRTPVELQQTDKTVLSTYRKASEIPDLDLESVTISDQNVATIPSSDSQDEDAMKTLGGLQYWSDIHFFRDYRIQQNVLTSQCRLLDRRNNRHASGSFEECVTALEGIRTEKNLAPMSGEAVVLLHGILRSANSFTPLRVALEKDGYYAIPVNYPSTRITIEKAAEDLHRVITSLEGIETVHLVGHSMGGLVIRAWFALPQTQSQTQRIGRVIMMGTPNHGAELADRLHRFPPFQWVMGQAGQQLRTDFGTVDKLPIPTVPFGIIAGGRGENTNGYNPLMQGDDDGTVTVASTHLEGESDFCSFPCLHMLLMRDPRSIEATRNFLKHGSFTDQALTE
ncbi:alpha/beta fold hydrolase [Rubinisphaera margarita]|uniref:alpha/beta fold hydrolase n=1 Tax=Rubinisphaera margarita TaxID=2909586 RepID=UPI001EE9358F|nr:alpha/beta fold hydrolase [Rubinisphaera margarita]MCG6154878.1 alpha/beta fold hydrolase [Rubinisphaera margarita]